MSLENRLAGGQFWLQNYAVLEVKGEDRSRYMQGQLTQDVESLKEGQGTLATRLTNKGKLVSFFFYVRSKDFDYIVVEQALVEITKSDLEKFIIMDDVEIEIVDLKILAEVGTSALLSKHDQSFELNLFEEPGKLSFYQETFELNNELSAKEQESYRFFSCFPKWDYNVDSSQFINDSRLNELAISYKKGCFLGQETVAKINNNRGASYYPCFLKTDDVLFDHSKFTAFQVSGRKGGIFYGHRKLGEDVYLEVSLFREFRVQGKEITFELDGKTYLGEVCYAPFYGTFSPTEKSKEYYEKAVELFQADKEEEALQLLEASVLLDSQFADAYEVMGVILGRHHRYDEGIQFMDKLLEVDPTSVMAHTNKSLYLMKLGKIEEAEEEKSKATVKTFEKFGAEAQAKKRAKEEEEAKKADIERREGMFLQVLEIDAEDTLANYGLADIAFYREQYDQVEKYIGIVLEQDPKYSNAYLLLGKALVELKENDRAIEVFEKGIEVSSKNGDLMPANAMQAKLNELKR